MEIANNTSFEFPKALTCLSKTFSYPKSFERAVITEVSLFKAMAGNGRRFTLYLPINSATKCWQSEADPPLPQKINLPPLSKH